MIKKESIFGCHDALKIYGAKKLCTVMYQNHHFSYIRSGIFRKIKYFFNHENFSKSFTIHIGKNKWKLWWEIVFWISWCIKDLLGIKVMYCYVVKWPVFCLQRGSAKSPLAPSDFSSLCPTLLYYPWIVSCALCIMKTNHCTKPSHSTKGWF